MRIRETIIFGLVLLSSMYLSGQTGTISGNIKDGKLNEGMIGATVSILGTTSGTTTDLDGNFELTSVKAGQHTVVITYLGYTTITLEKVIVEANKATVINTSLQESSTVLDVVEVKAQRKTDTEIFVVSEIKNLNNIAVGVSSQSITKTQDRDASQVVRRVPGVSIFDDRFIVVRGLNERYNSVLLNDIVTPSTEVDVKSFSFDLIPSSAIDRMLIYKSPSAEIPGDIAGGAIKIFTKTVPDDNKISLGFTVGYRGNATGNTVVDYRGQSLDAIGFGGGARTLPSTFPTTKNVINGARSTDIIQNFKNLPEYYNIGSKTVMPDLRGSLNFSRRMEIAGKTLTNISYLSYSNTNTFQQMLQNRYLADESIQNTFNDNNYNNNIRVGVMTNWGLILNSRNKIEFRNLFNQLATKETVQRKGQLFENALDLDNQSYRYEQKSIYSGQLSGTHELTNKSTFTWIGGFGYTNRKEPDFRRFTSSRPIGTNQPFKIDLQQFESPTLQQAARFYSGMTEAIGTIALNYDLVVGTKYEDKEKNTLVKLGTYSEYKDRSFAARWFGIVNPNRLGTDFTTLSPSDLFSTDNLTPSLVYYSEGTNFDDAYTAQNNLNAAYVSLYKPINDNLNFTLGIRGEYNIQQLQSRERGGGSLVDVNNPIFSPLPSLNATYKITERNLLRFGYGTTINRPEFRELAPFTYYDFIFDVSRRGNKDIKVATIHNFDVRYDFYPSKGELITIGAFYKRFKNPIEAAIFYNGSNISFTVANSESAVSQGIEFEMRKDISQKFTAVFNASLINSDVRVSGLSETSRYLQGQSPYLVNAGLFYNDRDHGFQANLMYNVIGKRIYVIGDQQLSGNVFEMPRNVIDFNLSKKLGRAELKAGVQDLLNQPFKLLQDTNFDNKITNTDGVFQQFQRGSNYFVTINYTL